MSVVRECSKERANAFLAGSGLGVRVAPKACFGAFRPGGLFGDDVQLVAVLTIGRPSARWQSAKVEFCLAGACEEYIKLLRIATESLRGEVAVAYADLGGPVAPALRLAGWQSLGLRGGGHIGFDVLDPAGASRAFVGARSAVVQLGTRSVARVATLRPHWRPRYAPRREVFCWPPEAAESLGKTR